MVVFYVKAAEVTTTSAVLSQGLQPRKYGPIFLLSLEFIITAFFFLRGKKEIPMLFTFHVSYFCHSIPILTKKKVNSLPKTDILFVGFKL